MARYTGPVCRLCRREGDKLYLKGDRCYSDKCAINRRKYAPGQHGMSRKKLSEYGLQLREKQKARRHYGVLEKQFRKYFEMASNKKGVTGENLLAILESRLDNAVYKLGFTMSRAEARQLIRHGHFEINGRRVTISSILLKVGDVIKLSEKSAALDKFKNNVEANANRTKPTWLEYNGDAMEAKVVSTPAREDVEIPLEEHLIVELYSK
ncbi:MAG: 30S ribosomal protein S4 [Clostridia bacterium]|nr:30S ribosomal protein S4 [Clostridia bacterium]